MRVLSDGTLVAKEVELNGAEGEHEYEGTIVEVGSGYIKLVVSQSPSATLAQIGESATITIDANTRYRVDSGDLTLPAGVQFASAADLMVGQYVEVESETEACDDSHHISGTVRRIRLHNSRITARVKTLASPDFTIDDLPSLLTTTSPYLAEVNVKTSAATRFEHVGGINDLASGNKVSVRGLLFTTGGTPVLVAEKVRKR